METFSVLLAIFAGNSPVTGEFHAQRPVTRSFDVFFDPRMNKQLSKQSYGWWFEMPSRSLWRHCNDFFQRTDNAYFFVSFAYSMDKLLNKLLNCRWLKTPWRSSAAIVMGRGLISYTLYGGPFFKEHNSERQLVLLVWQRGESFNCLYRFFWISIDMILS